MRYLHTIVRVRDLPAALRCFRGGLGLRALQRGDALARPEPGTSMPDVGEV